MNDRYITVPFEKIQRGDIIVKDFTQVGVIDQPHSGVSNQTTLLVSSPEFNMGKTINTNALRKYKFVRKAQNNISESEMKQMSEMFKQAGLTLTDEEIKSLEG